MDGDLWALGFKICIAAAVVVGVVILIAGIAIGMIL